MSSEKILLTVLTYPQPSLNYDDSFCTAGFRENGEMIRLYPLPFARYTDLHKYSFVELEIKKRRKGDPRPESYSPVDYNLRDLKVLRQINTENEWSERRQLCLKNVYEDFDKLIEHSKEPNYKSLAVFKPKEIVDFKIEADERDWKQAWKEKMNQMKIFEDMENKQKLEKIPFKFKYHFKDSKNKVHKLTVLDWEAGVLYRNCMVRANGNEKEAVEKVRQKYFDEFLKKDIYFFLGTTLKWHLGKAKNPFAIIGVFYPPKVKETKTPLFG